MNTLNIALITLFVLMIVLAFVTISVQKAFIRKNEVFALKQSSKQRTGVQVAQMILEKNGITNIKVIVGQEGKDHYNPKTGVISLSPSVYNSSSVSAMAIAAHECGHAIQWHKKSVIVRVRETIMTPVSIATRIGSAMFSMGLMVFLFLPVPNFFAYITIAGLIMYSAMGLFQLITLPLEFDASSKAKKELAELGLMTTENDIKGTKGVLNAAAMTYVVAFLSTATVLAMFIIRFIMMTRNN